MSLERPPPVRTPALAAVGRTPLPVSLATAPTVSTGSSPLLPSSPLMPFGGGLGTGSSPSGCASPLAQLALGSHLASPAHGSSPTGNMSPTVMRKYALLQRSALGKFAFPASDDVSGTAKKFISSLLQVDPLSRLSAAEALRHQWLQHRSSASAPTPAETPSREASGELMRPPAKASCAGRSCAGAPTCGCLGGDRGSSSPVAARRSMLSAGGSGRDWTSSPSLQRDSRETGSRGADGSGDGQSTPEGIRHIQKHSRSILPQSSDDDSGSGDDSRGHGLRRAGPGSSSQRMMRPPALGRVGRRASAPAAGGESDW